MCKHTRIKRQSLPSQLLHIEGGWYKRPPDGHLRRSGRRILLEFPEPPPLRLLRLLLRPVLLRRRWRLQTAALLRGPCHCPRLALLGRLCPWLLLLLLRRRVLRLRRVLARVPVRRRRVAVLRRPMTRRRAVPWVSVW